MIGKFEYVVAVKSIRNFLARIISKVQWLILISTNPPIKKVAILLKQNLIEYHNIAEVNNDSKESLS